MRRIGALVTALLLLFCSTAAANEGEDFQLHGSVTGRDTGVYPVNFMMWTGPGSDYAPVDYNICCDLQTAQVRVFSQVWNERQLWILVEANHFELGKVRGYMVAIDAEGNRVFSYDQNAVPWEDSPGSFTDLSSCLSYENELFRYGPGEEYAYSGLIFTLEDYGHIVLTDGEWALVDGPWLDPINQTHYQRGWIRLEELIY